MKVKGGKRNRVTCMRCGNRFMLLSFAPPPVSPWKGRPWAKRIRSSFTSCTANRVLRFSDVSDWRIAKTQINTQDTKRKKNVDTLYERFLLIITQITVEFSTHTRNQHVPQSIPRFRLPSIPQGGRFLQKRQERHLFLSRNKTHDSHHLPVLRVQICIIPDANQKTDSWDKVKRRKSRYYSFTITRFELTTCLSLKLASLTIRSVDLALNIILLSKK